jgi:hypothetical protein
MGWANARAKSAIHGGAWEAGRTAAPTAPPGRTRPAGAGGKFALFQILPCFPPARKIKL